MHDVFDWYRAFEAYLTRVTLHTGLPTAVSFHSPQSALRSGSNAHRKVRVSALRLLVRDCP